VPINNPPPTYETHDYSAVEEHITRQNERRVLANKSKNAAVFTSYLKYGSLGIVALGVTAFLLLWGISLLNEEKLRVIEKKAFIEKPVAQVTSIIPQLEEIERSMKRTLASNPQKKNRKAVDAIDVTTQFNVFKNVPSGIHGFKNVVTGLVFPNSKTAYPTSQYCYIEAEPNGTVKKSMELAYKDKFEPIKYFSYASDSSLKISPSQFKFANKKCRFLK
jgi:hypothetical protein